MHASKSVFFSIRLHDAADHLQLNLSSFWVIYPNYVCEY